MASDVQVPSQVADGMRAEVAAIEHLQGSASVTSRGISTEITIDPGTAGDGGATGQMIEQVRQTLRDVAAPVPDEDVGRGARWQKYSMLDGMETRFAETETFTFLENSCDKATPGGRPGANGPLSNAARTGHAARCPSTDGIDARFGQREGTLDSIASRATDHVRWDDDDGRVGAVSQR